MRIVALANQKGGVGKTTTAVHLAHGIALAGRNVALIDLDPQGNATVAVQEMSLEKTPGGLQRLAEQLWLLPSMGPAGAPPEAGSILRELETTGVELEFAVIDCPPRMDEWGWAGLRLAGEVIVPVQAEFLAMHGLSQILATLAGLPAVKVRGILPTMVDLKEPITAEVLRDLRKNLGSLVMQTTIVRDSSLVEAASFGRTIFQHNPHAKAALCYASLTMEFISG